MKPNQRSEQRGSLSTADRLHRLRHVVIRKFVEQVRRELPQTNSESNPVLADSLPQLLDEIEKKLRRSTDLHLIPRIEELGKIQGERFARLGNYPFSHIVREYQILRQVIGSELNEEASLEFKDYADIQDVLDRGVTMASQYFVEITAEWRRQSEDRLENEQVRFETLIKQLPVGVVVAEAPSGKFLFANDEVLAIWGHGMIPTGDIEQYREWKGRHLDGRPYLSHEWPLARAVKNGEVVDEEFAIITTPDGQEKIITLTAAPVRDRGNRIIAGVVICQDVTESRRAEEVLRQSEERFRQIANSMPQIVWTARPDGFVDWFSEKFLEYAPDLSTRWDGPQSPLHPEDVSLTIERWKKALESGQPYEIEHRLRRKADGMYRWHLARGLPVRDEGGRIIKWVGSATDIHERKSLQDQLLRAQDELNFALRSAKMGMWSIDLKGGSVRNSPFLAELLGVAKEEKDVFGAIARVIHPDDRDELNRAWQEAVAKRESYSQEYRIVRPDGSIRWVLAKGELRYSPDGEPVDLIGVSVDITERKQAEDELRQAHETVKEHMSELHEERELRERFVATLSHDLRTPLTAAKMGAQLLIRRGADPKVLGRTAPKISENIDRADQMIRDLLDANRIKAGEQLPIEVAKCDLGMLALDTLEELSTVHGDRFVLKVPAKVEGFWSCGGMRRIIENLCNNAIKYGAANRPVTVDILRDDQSVKVVVHNYGPPIDSRDQKTLFEPFTRTASAVIGSQKGWGLGLTLVRGIAEAHGGSVAVESSAESGTTFTVVLPLDSRSSG